MISIRTQQIAHLSIDFAAADDGRIDPASYHHRFASSYCREIAFMTDARVTLPGRTKATA
jgi:hypothetical protein